MRRKDCGWSQGMTETLDLKKEWNECGGKENESGQNTRPQACKERTDGGGQGATFVGRRVREQSGVARAAEKGHEGVSESRSPTSKTPVLLRCRATASHCLE